MDPIKTFRDQVASNIKALGENDRALALSRQWSEVTNADGYTYNFTWLGRPVIQYPQDLVAMQELVWSVRPDLIIETGIAHGGSLIFSASLLAQLDMVDAIGMRTSINPAESSRRVLGVDIDIRAHNRRAIEDHPMASRIQMIQGSSVDDAVVSEVQKTAAQFDRVMVVLDSNHTHEHVLAELEAYAHLASVGSYCVVFDTLIEDMPAEMFDNRPWGPGDNPKTAVWEFLKTHPEFEIDRSIQDKLQITVAPDGYLRRVKS
jgi:cephalosporin hydroxylase